MIYIIQALRYTYHTERKAYPGLNDLINQLEDEDTLRDVYDTIYTLLSIDESLHDINLPKEDV
jgi:hypothetical protein